MKRFSRLLIFLAFLLVLLLIARFLEFRTEQQRAIPVADDLQRLFTQPFFTLGQTAITPTLLCTVIVFLVLIAFSSSLSKKFMRRVLLKTHLDEGQRYAIEVGTGYLVFVIGILILLQSAGLNLSSLTVLGGAIGVGVGFGLQNIFNNFVSGLILLVERPIKLGDRVEIQNLLGDVVRIGARSTWVRTNDDIIIIVPNSEFISNSVTNWTASERQIRLSIPIGVAYESDLEQVRDLLLNVAKAHGDVLEEPAPDVILTEFGDSSINFSLRVWTINQVRTTSILKSDLYFGIHRAFAKHGIEIPFPQRDLHIRSSIPIPFSSQHDDHPIKTWPTNNG